MSALLPAGLSRLPALTRRLLRLLSGLLTLLCLALGLAAPVRADTPAPLLLRDEAGSLDGWAVARVLPDAEGQLTLAQVLARQADFSVPVGRAGNLGKRGGAVWLRLPLQVPADGGGRWMLDIDYPSLDRIDVYLLDAGVLRQQAQLGDHLAVAQRPLPSRSHALVLDLRPGQTALLLLRVQTSGSMLVPLALSTPADYQQREAREQALQGLLAGTSLCLLLYSLARWFSLRDPVFGLYALTLLGTVGFFAALSGMGPQHVWGASQWLTRNGAPFFILVGVCGAFFFVQRALEVSRDSPRVARVIQAAGGLAGLGAALFAAGVLSYAQAQALGMALGPTPLLLVLPTAFRRLRGGDRAAAYVLVGWGSYSVGVLVLVSLLQGWVPVGFWTLHGFQFASLIEMAMGLLVLGERVDQMRREATLVQRERDVLHRLANTDVLTGLHNRRGLQQLLPALLAQAQPSAALAVFVLDLDGFKKVNDTLGHEAGDELLVGVAQRLREQLRRDDLVCRLGGDEFVLALPGIKAEAHAEQIGMKLLQAFAEPFQAAGQACRVGLTAGYALAPQDDTTVNGLLKRADAAMYAGKQAGRNCLRRGQASLGLRH